MCFCVRSDGTAMLMEESAMVFEEKVRERDAGVYSCQASFYHHSATVSFLVEVMSDEKLFGECLHLYIGEKRAEACSHLGNRRDQVTSFSQGW